MISKLASIIAEKFIKNPNVNYNKVEIYQYGFFILLSNTIFFIITIIFGIIFNSLVQSVIFYLSFFLIRQYAGGYHASTETKCEILSTFFIFTCVLIIYLSKIFDINDVLFHLGLFASLIIAVISPLDSPEKTLSENEIKCFRRICLILLIIELCIIIISYYFKLSFIFKPICIGIILESVLLIIGKIKKTLLKNQC